MYNPDRWVVVKISTKKETHYRVLAGWFGGYLNGDSWRMNSGITKVEDKETHYLFHGYSNSVYNCSKNSYGTNSLMAGIIAQVKESKQYTLEVLENQDFSKLI